MVEYALPPAVGGRATFTLHPAPAHARRHTTGAEFPDFRLPDHTDSLRRLSELQGADPMVLTLHRGMFCPKDRMQLLQLVPFHAECVVGYTRLVSISSDDDLVSVNELRQGVGAHGPFLYDAERVIAMSSASRSTRTRRIIR